MQFVHAGEIKIEAISLRIMYAYWPDIYTLSTHWQLFSKTILKKVLKKNFDNKLGFKEQ